MKIVVQKVDQQRSIEIDKNQNKKKFGLIKKAEKN